MTTANIREAFKKLSQKIELLCILGNAPYDGNSEGNVIAQSMRAYLTTIQSNLDAAETDAGKIVSGSMTSARVNGNAIAGIEFDVAHLTSAVATAHLAIADKARRDALEEFIAELKLVGDFSSWEECEVHFRALAEVKS